MPYQVDHAGGWTSSIPGSGVGQVFNESPLDGTNDDDGTDIDDEADGDDNQAAEVSTLPADTASSQVVDLAKQDAWALACLVRSPGAGQPSMHHSTSPRKLYRLHGYLAKKHVAFSPLLY